MPTFGTDPDPIFYRMVAKWRKHFEDKGVSHKKVYRLAQKNARREYNQLKA